MSLCVSLSLVISDSISSVLGIMTHNTGRKLKQTEMLLFHSSAMAEFHYRALKNKNHKHSINEVNNLGYTYDWYFYKQPHQDLGLYGFSSTCYRWNCFSSPKGTELCMRHPVGSPPRDRNICHWGLLLKRKALIYYSRGLYLHNT